MIALVFALILFAPEALAQAICAPAPCSDCLQMCAPGICPDCPGGGTDYTADPDCVAVWALPSLSDPKTDGCGGDDDLTLEILDADNVEPTEEVDLGPEGTKYGGYVRILSQPTNTDEDEGFRRADLGPLPNRLEPDNFSAGCWFRTPARGQNIFITKGHSGSGGWYLGTTADPDYQISAALYNPAEIPAFQAEYSATGVIQNDTWIHIALVYDSTNDEIQIYKDGKDACTNPCNTQPLPDFDTNERIKLGYDGFFPNVNQAEDLMECFFMQRALSQAEVCEIVRNGFKNDAIPERRIAAYGDCR